MTLTPLYRFLYRWVLLIATLAGPTLAMAADPDLPAPIADQNYRLIKDWTFGRTIQNLEELRAEFFTRYVYNGGTLDKLNNEWQRYRDNDNHEFSNNGFALVARVPRELKNGQIESGMLRSKWIGQYGYIESRVKVPSGRGMWPAFWLNPQDQTWPPEIDIMEIVNNGRDTTKNSFHMLHSGDGKYFPSTMSRLDRWGSYRPGFDYADDFHTFAVLWEPGRVRHYVDEKLVADRPFYWQHKSGVDAGSAHILVNLAVGGDWPGAPQDIADFPARMQIDYIRVWQK
ncbi:family 16 glycosylhydrolase [Rhodoferax sp. WC2427]|uniref:glycoside hydrolase family 16 protein n=1 Tax=Rhodoferax sp. WC2427 TaxID=3234144 RepID=UPI003466CF70